MSLRARLGLALGAVLLALAVSGAAILQLVHASLNDGLDRQLKAATTLVAAPVSRPFPAGQAFDPPPSGSPNQAPRLSELFIGEYSSTGELTPFLEPDLGTSETPDVTVAVARRHAGTSGSTRPFNATTTDGTHGFRVVTVRAGSRLLLIALPADRVALTYGRVKIGMLGGAIALLSTLVIAGWWVERLGLRPIKDVTDAAAAIATGHLDHRVNSPSPRTEAGRLGQAFNVMVEQRQASEQRLRQFVADASHELRTPLSTIAGVLELHHTKSLRGAALDEGLGRANQEVKRMSGLVSDLLELADLDHGHQVDSVPVNLGQLVTDAAFDASMAYPDRRVLTFVGPQAVVAGDEARLRQVVANLLTNALTHADPDGAIRITVEGVGQSTLIEVADDGPGMSPEHAMHIFERFYRVDAGRSRTQGGSGLGLSIAKSIVEAHGGTITVSTAVHHGSSFRVLLPARREAHQAALRGS